jgi:hypothetical protein
MTDENGNSGTAPKNERQYSVFAPTELSADDLSEDGAKRLQELLGFEGPYEIEIRTARAVQSTPRKAIEVAAGLRSLNGTFDVVADSAITTLTVATETKPTVSIK